jgi:2-polyprenyl-3-methyl-5-hydroxy-6-metoxy-1,4-benzoquinol methylase
MKYDRRISLDPHSEDQILLSILGTGQSVLELGCHTGHFSTAAIANGNVVVGVDIDARAVETARQSGIDATVIDLDLPDVLPQDGRFDVVLMANVLEHLHDPARLVRDAASAVHKTGRLLVSVPNVAHYTVRLALLRGRFDYTRVGILDETHLRFYTRKTLRRLLEDNGWRIVRERSAPMVVSSIRGRLLRNLASQLPNLFSVHLIAEAQPIRQPNHQSGERHEAERIAASSARWRFLDSK